MRQSADHVQIFTPSPLKEKHKPCLKHSHRHLLGSIAFTFLAMVNCPLFWDSFIQHYAIFLFTLRVSVSEESFLEALFFGVHSSWAKRLYATTRLILTMLQA
jgi:hypothetical protein